MRHGGFFFAWEFPFGPWGRWRRWGVCMGGPWRPPRREEYLRMLERYKWYLEECKAEIEEELRQVEKEIEELRGNH